MSHNLLKFTDILLQATLMLDIGSLFETFHPTTDYRKASCQAQHTPHRDIDIIKCLHHVIFQVENDIVIEELPSSSTHELSQPSKSTENYIKFTRLPKSDGDGLQVSACDFGNVINKNVTSMTNNERYEWLTNPWTPSPQFKFPLNLEGTGSFKQLV